MFSFFLQEAGSPLLGSREHQVQKFLHFYLLIFIFFLNSVLRIRDQVLFLTPGSGTGKKNQDPDPGWTSRIIFPRAYSLSLETIFWVKIYKFLDTVADPDPGSGNLFDPGSGIRDGKILYPGSGGKHPGSATLLKIYLFILFLFFVQSEVRYLGRQRRFRVHNVQPHQVHDHERRPRDHQDAGPARLPHQDQGQPGLLPGQGLQAQDSQHRPHRVPLQARSCQQASSLRR